MDESSINELPEAKAVKQLYPRIQSLIDEQIKGMIIGAKNYQHYYEVHNNKIMYKDQDGLSEKISYGYKTIFAYMYEYYERKTISENSM